MKLLLTCTSIYGGNPTIIGKNSGTNNAVIILLSNVYNVRHGTLPPNLPVTTAAAVAVGAITHNIELSAKYLLNGYKATNTTTVPIS